MISPDIALAALINRAGASYLNAAPAFISYTEHTHVTGANRAENIDRSVLVRVADNYAVMHDLPRGATRFGSAFPLIPFFDPFSNFQYCYYANLKKIDIKFIPGTPFNYPIPAANPAVVSVPYMHLFAPRYAPDSSDEALHILTDPTPANGVYMYPSDVREDPMTHLPSHVTIQEGGSDTTIGLDFSVIEGHWVVTHGTYSASQHVAFLNFKVNADITYTDISFPATAPDPQLAGTPGPVETCPH